MVAVRHRGVHQKPGGPGQLEINKKNISSYGYIIFKIQREWAVREAQWQSTCRELRRLRVRIQPFASLYLLQTSQLYILPSQSHNITDIYWITDAQICNLTQDKLNVYSKVSCNRTKVHSIGIEVTYNEPLSLKVLLAPVETPTRWLTWVDTLTPKCVTSPNLTSCRKVAHDWYKM